MRLPLELQNHYSSLILFDGICNLCNGLVAFVIRHDRSRRFRFASLQSKAGQRILQGLGFSSTELNTMIYIRGDSCFVGSAAGLNIFRDLGGLWSLLYAGILVPQRLRDVAYSFLARHRYQWFGKRHACLVPTPELKDLFLE